MKKTPKAARHLEPPPHALVEDGRVRFGHFSAGVREPNLIDARRPFGVPMPRALRDARLKEWQAMQLGNGRVFLHVALFQAKSIAMVQLKLYDRATKKKLVLERPVLPGSFRVAQGLYGTRTAYERRGLHVAFENDLDRGSLLLRLDVKKRWGFPRVRGELALDTSKTEPLVVSIPFGKSRGMYSHKGLFPVEGRLQIGKKEHRFHHKSGYALIDDHKGYYDYRMRWDWLTGAAYDARGDLVGFNLTRNASIDPEGYNENCFWRNGAITLLPAVRFTRDPQGEREVWRVRDEHGRVDVSFEVEVQGDVKLNLGLIKSNYRGPFGHIRGRLAGVTGEALELDGVFGMAEDFDLRC
jgi:hypothetical protein